MTTQDRSFVLSRRELLAGAIALAALPQWQRAPAAQTPRPLLTRPIPSSQEPLPVIGLGTPLIFDYEPDPAKQAQMTQLIAALVAGGGRMLDTADGYGKGEARLGEIIAALKIREKLFLSTKFSMLRTPEQQAEAVRNSTTLLGTSRLDLLYAWGVTDDGYDLGHLRELRSAGTTRYIGIATGRNPDLERVAKLVARDKPDFLFFAYSIGNRGAEERLFPVAQDAGTAVMGTLPFDGSALFRKVGDRPLPDWAGGIGAASWAQFFLKFVLAHPAIVGIVPGTNKVANLQDNLDAGRSAAPNAEQRQRMIDYWASLG